jgi:cytochrome c
MKKVLVAMSLVASISIAENLNACKGCHGQNFEKVALGKSKVVADMTKEEIIESLSGYQDGTYGGALKGVMKGQVAKYKPEDFETMADVIKGDDSNESEKTVISK